MTPPSVRVSDGRMMHEDRFEQRTAKEIGWVVCGPQCGDAGEDPHRIGNLLGLLTNSECGNPPYSHSYTRPKSHKWFESALGNESLQKISSY
jgi:hypothetical protein